MMNDEDDWRKRVEHLARKMVEWKGQDPDLQGHHMIPVQVSTPEGTFTAHPQPIKLWQCYEHIAACALREMEDEV